VDHHVDLGVLIMCVLQHENDEFYDYWLAYIIEQWKPLSEGDDEVDGVPVDENAIGYVKIAWLVHVAWDHRGGRSFAVEGSSDVLTDFGSVIPTAMGKYAGATEVYVLEKKHDELMLALHQTGVDG